MQDPQRDAVRRLVAALDADETIVPETLRTMRATVPGYEGVPTASLEASVRRNRSLSIRAILEGRAPDADHVPEAETLAAERLDQGVSIGSVLAGFRVSMSVILQQLLVLAPRFGIPAAEALSLSTLLWSVGDVFSTRAVVAYQERGIAQAVADSARRARWIADAVVSGVPRTELQRGAATYQIPDETPVRALRITFRAQEPQDPDPSGRLQDWVREAGARAVVAPHGDGGVGILIGDLSDAADAAEPPRATVAVGPAVALADLPDSYAVASRILEAAHRVGYDGVVDVARLSWRMGISSSPETTELLHRRHLAPLQQEGPFGDLILEAVHAYLGNGLNIPRAAAAVPVHVNTLRYRLKRFRELTSADLHDLDTLIEVSWAIAAHTGVQGRQRSHAPRDS